jgi:hypothetical protein
MLTEGAHTAGEDQKFSALVGLKRSERRHKSNAYPNALHSADRQTDGELMSKVAQFAFLLPALAFAFEREDSAGPA